MFLNKRLKFSYDINIAIKKALDTHYDYSIVETELTKETNLAYQLLVNDLAKKAIGLFLLSKTKRG